MSITEGLHVPEIPLIEVAGSVGAVDPAQKGAIFANLGMRTGFDKIRAVLRSVVQPLAVNMKSE